MADLVEYAIGLAVDLEPAARELLRLAAQFALLLERLEQELELQ